MLQSHWLFIRETLFKDRYMMWAAIWIILFSLSSELANLTLFHFKPNTYVPPNLEFMIFLSIMYPFSVIAIPHLSKFAKYHPDLCYITFYLCLITLMLNSCQLTPNATIDHILMKVEFLPLINYLKWVHQHSAISNALFLIYNSLQYLLFFVPVVAYFIGNRTFKNFVQYFILSSAFGFTFYYCFPSCGPASVFSEQYFYNFQHANHIKFFEIHHGLPPSTIEGGLIAFPSFHVIWAWACTRIWIQYPKIFFSFFIWFLLICCSCVLLGWHYSIDVLGSIFFIFMIESFLKQKNKLTI